MNSSWKLGRVAGINLFLHWTFLLLLVWAALTRGLDSAMFLSAVFGCVVLHELGHALTARLFGVRTRDITLYPIGGVATLEHMPRAPGAELLITLAGPAVNVAIAAVLFLAVQISAVVQPWSDASPVIEFAETLMWVNVALAVFNMIPAFPMDGGRVFRALLTAPLGRYRATEIAAGLGRVIAFLLPLIMISLGIFSPWNLVLSVFIFLAAGSELAQVRFEESRDRGPEAWNDGVRIAPPGYRWENRGNGFWQLAPITVASEARERRPWH